MRMGSLFNSWQRMALVIVLSLAAVGCGNKRSGNEPPPQYQPEVYDDGQQTWPSQAPQMVLVRRNGRMLEYATTTVVSERELREVIRSRSLRWRPANESITGEYPLNPTSGLYFVEKPNEISVDKAWSADPQNMSSMAVELDDDSSYRPHRPGHWRGHRGYQLLALQLSVPGGLLELSSLLRSPGEQLPALLSPLFFLQ